MASHEKVVAAAVQRIIHGGPAKRAPVASKKATGNVKQTMPMPKQKVSVKESEEVEPAKTPERAEHEIHIHIHSHRA